MFRVLSSQSPSVPPPPPRTRAALYLSTILYYCFRFRAWHLPSLSIAILFFFSLFFLNFRYTGPEKPLTSCSSGVPAKTPWVWRPAFPTNVPDTPKLLLNQLAFHRRLPPSLYCVPAQVFSPFLDHCKIHLPVYRFPLQRGYLSSPSSPPLEKLGVTLSRAVLFRVRLFFLLNPRHLSLSIPPHFFCFAYPLDCSYSVIAFFFCAGAFFYPEFPRTSAGLKWPSPSPPSSHDTTISQVKLLFLRSPLPQSLLCVFRSRDLP